MNTLILSPREIEDAEILSKAAQENGWKVSKLARWRVAKDFKIKGDIAIYGEPLFARVIAAQLERVLLEPEYDWLTKLEFEFVSRRIEYTAINKLANYSYPMFIKPPDDKLFTAKVYTSASEILSRKDLDGNQEVLVSEPVTFTKEYRSHILNGEIVSCTRYLMNSELDVSSNDESIKRAKTFVERLLKETRTKIPPAVVIDVGLLDSGEFAVVEANPCFGAGIYEGNAEAILKVLVAACCSLDDSRKELENFKFPLEIE